MSTLIFLTLNNVKSTFSILTLILITSKQCYYFERQVLQRLSTSRQHCKNNHFQRIEKSKIIELQKKMAHLIKNTCFWLWTMKKKWKHGRYNVKINSLVLELWQFSFIRHWPEMRKLEIVSSEFCAISKDWGKLGNICAYVSNKNLLNVTKYQGYSSYRFWVIKGKPTGR